MKHFKRGLIVVLENAYLEVAKVGTEYKLLNCDDHVSFLTKKGRDPAQARPDIVHQCLMTLLDSPLNKAGLLKIYVSTVTHNLIDVNPKLRIPRTFKRFSGLMVQLLHKLSIKAEGMRGEAILKLVKNPVSLYFPPNVTVVGTSYSSTNLVDIFDYVPTLFPELKREAPSGDDVKEPSLKKIKIEIEEDDGSINSTKQIKSDDSDGNDNDNSGDDDGDNSDGTGDDEDGQGDGDGDEEEVDSPPQNFDVKEGVTFTSGKKKTDRVVVFVIGAMSHGKVNADYLSEEIAISKYPLSGSVVCGKVCAAFERFFGVV